MFIKKISVHVTQYSTYSTVQHLRFHIVIWPAADPTTHSLRPKGEQQVAVTLSASLPTHPYIPTLKYKVMKIEVKIRIRVGVRVKVKLNWTSKLKQNQFCN